MSQPEFIQKLLACIEQKLGWGRSADWQGKDFENLSLEILNNTGVSLSASTLKRIWGKVDYQHLPSMTTLDTLSRFAGFESWRNFQKTEHTILENADANKILQRPARRRKLRSWLLTWSILLAAGVSIAAIWAMRRNDSPPNSANFRFSSEPLTHGIPNSVVFSYDAIAAPNDSVFIQQSWDPSTRAVVNKNSHTYTSIYYEPGFYRAKLIIGNRIVKEHPLLIPTNGWLGIIQNKPVPIYLKTASFQHADGLDLAIEEIKKSGIPTSPQPPAIKFYNVGNFEAVPVDSFSFTVQVKNTFNEGAGVCQFTYVSLITDDAPIFIPLSIKGCSSNLMLRNFDEVFPGRNANLSGFGADLSQWVKITCRSAGRKIEYLVNDKQVFAANAPSKKINIVGIGFYFQGTGAAKDIELTAKGQLAFSAFQN